MIQPDEWEYTTRHNWVGGEGDPLEIVQEICCLITQRNGTYTNQYLSRRIRRIAFTF